ncbi:hypothetical protein FE257_007736 [Aspergillus nanangensis]|uniref:Toxin biosynthesis protein n=1 Tax=Aspergillus nanangensis TaxID=2582783 RepID=A0AAD4CWY2_ASPNN|nr:hypothetical protein FE257_007736 [Aspergillus nanangensis]
MTRPIFGLAHSMGAPQLLHAALTHPRLFHAQILIEPVLYDAAPAPTVHGPVHGAVRRRDRWVDRDALEVYVRDSPLYRSWDPRCRDRWMEYGVREVVGPIAMGGFDFGSGTGSGSGEHNTEVVLVTPRHQEAFTLTRPVDGAVQRRKTPSSSSSSSSSAELDLAIQRGASKYPLMQAEPMVVFHNLGFLKPAVLFMYGELSVFLKAGGLRERAMERTGRGVLGSGGVNQGRVKREDIENAGHMAPVEQPAVIARKAGGWIAREVQRWEEDLRRVEGEWKGKTGEERRMLDEEFLDGLGLGEKEKKMMMKL